MEKNIGKVLEGLLLGLTVEIGSQSYKYANKGELLYTVDDTHYAATFNDIFVSYGDRFMGTYMELGVFVGLVREKMTDDEYTVLLMNIGLNSLPKRPQRT